VVLAAGVVWSLTLLGTPKRAVEGVGTAAVIDTPTTGTRRPSDYNLPTYPTAFRFHSMDGGGAAGSVAFSVKKGTATEIAAFYRAQLPKKGWRLVRERDARQQIAAGRVKSVSELRGRRQEWTKAAKNQRLTLLTLDLKSDKSTAQAVMNWAPLEIPLGGSNPED
jgi:hypothetical protein